MLAIEYLLTKPAGVKSAVLASPMISMPLYNEEVELLKDALPNGTADTLRRHERKGTTDSEEYGQALAVYEKAHLFRSEAFPKEYSLDPSKDGIAVYHKMWGVSEACGNGTMKHWDRVDDLSKITTPTLITSGQYDELTPWQAGIACSHLPDAELRIFTNGAHLVHIEQADRYCETLETFLKKHDS